MKYRIFVFVVLSFISLFIKNVDSYGIFNIQSAPTGDQPVQTRLEDPEHNIVNEYVEEAVGKAFLPTNIASSFVAHYIRGMADYASKLTLGLYSNSGLKQWISDKIFYKKYHQYVNMCYHFIYQMLSIAHSGSQTRVRMDVYKRLGRKFARGGHKIVTESHSDVGTSLTPLLLLTLQRFLASEHVGKSFSNICVKAFKALVARDKRLIMLKYWTDYDFRLMALHATDPKHLAELLQARMDYEALSGTKSYRVYITELHISFVCNPDNIFAKELASGVSSGSKIYASQLIKTTLDEEIEAGNLPPESTLPTPKARVSVKKFNDLRKKLKHLLQKTSAKYGPVSLKNYSEIIAIVDEMEEMGKKIKPRNFKEKKFIHTIMKMLESIRKNLRVKGESGKIYEKAEEDEDEEKQGDKEEEHEVREEEKEEEQKEDEEEDDEDYEEEDEEEDEEDEEDEESEGEEGEEEDEIEEQREREEEEEEEQEEEEKEEWKGQKDDEDGEDEDEALLDNANKVADLAVLMGDLAPEDDTLLESMMDDSAQDEDTSDVDDDELESAMEEYVKPKEEEKEEYDDELLKDDESLIITEQNIPTSSEK